MGDVAVTGGPDRRLVRIGRLVWRHQALRDAVLRRIERQGDMNIRIRGETFATILRMCGTNTDHMDCEPYREVDAAALETLIRLGDW